MKLVSEAVNALNTVSQISETQMSDTQVIMHELSTDLEVTFRKVVGSDEILSSRPGIDPFEDTRPMYTSSDVGCIQQSSITATSPSVTVQPLRTQSGMGSTSSYIFGLQPSPWSILDHHAVDLTSL